MKWYSQLYFRNYLIYLENLHVARNLNVIESFSLGERLFCMKVSSLVIAGATRCKISSYPLLLIRWNWQKLSGSSQLISFRRLQYAPCCIFRAIQICPDLFPSWLILSSSSLKKKKNCKRYFFNTRHFSVKTNRWRNHKRRFYWLHFKSGSARCSHRPHSTRNWPCVA